MNGLSGNMGNVLPSTKNEIVQKKIMATWASGDGVTCTEIEISKTQSICTHFLGEFVRQRLVPRMMQALGLHTWIDSGARK